MRELLKVYLCHIVKFQFQLGHEHKIYILSQSSTENLLIESNKKIWDLQYEAEK
jgi:hypothetical protein